MLSATLTYGNLNKYVCIDGIEIGYHKICDGVKHCADGSDEIQSLCHLSLCQPDKFRCHYGACIDRKHVCDGKFNCVDKSDESNCGKSRNSCEKHEFRCNNQRCIPINNVCDGNPDCDDKSDETDACDDKICSINTYHCRNGGCARKKLLCDGIADCIDGSDETDIICREIKNKKAGRSVINVTCPPINSTNISIRCISSTEEVLDCHKPLPVNTTVKYECKAYYKYADPKYNTRIETKITCQLDGTWSGKFIMCEPDCGILAPAANLLIVKGWVAPKGHWPWHAVIYLLDDDTFTFSCGATLISENIVLTAAHCVWQVDVNKMMIGMGKYDSNYNEPEAYTQLRKVDKVIIPPTYQDYSGNYGSDIAAVYLDVAVELSEEVKPACIDWNLINLKEQLKDNSIGKIAGMGVTENGNFSTELLFTYLPVVDVAKCIQSEDNDFRKYITYNTFCAGFTNGTGVCNGDSGGGLLFKTNNGQWFLQGITSLSPRKRGTSVCQPEKYTVFTKVASYIGWLEDILQ